jgi:hypothetical protein
MDLIIDIAQWFLLLAIFAAFLISSIFRRNKELVPIQLYIFLLFVVNVVMKLLIHLSKPETYKYLSTSIINLFSVLEIIIIYYFLYFKIKRIQFRILMGFFLTLFLSTCVIFWTVRKNTLFSFAPDLFGLECLLITIPCLFYVYEILRTEYFLDLKSNVKFIITCGLLFNFSLLVPIYFSWSTLFQINPDFNKILNFLSILFYSLLVIVFVKAYLCPITVQKQ